MMQVGYYPGCTLKDKAKALDETTHIAVRMLGKELQEIPDWTCCGATTPLVSTKIANLIAQTRLLIKTRDAGYDAIVTTCPFCFSTLRRVNLILAKDELKRKRINAYLADDRRNRDYDTPSPPYEPYSGETKVLHLLEWLRDSVGWEYISHSVTNALHGLKIAPFYGCQLLRPSEEIALDDPEDPHLFEDFLWVIGAEVLDFPERIDCCGSYLTVAKPNATVVRSHAILEAANRLGADAVVVTCPLCFYNFDSLQPQMQNDHPEFSPIPIFYFTQLLALALGAPLGQLNINSHKIDPTPLLESLPKIHGEVKA
ncbi:MAG TPA: heterodisulfide reductase, subunit B [Firmicutes bacterium]|nr:heterodisulfide reductase, subunit B [Bacillota bacterium]